MPGPLILAWNDHLTEYDFGPGHPLAPVRVELHSVALPWPGEDATLENEGAALEDGLWTRSRDFDWGD